MGTIRSEAAALALIGALAVAGCQQEAPPAGSVEEQTESADAGVVGDTAGTREAGAGDGPVPTSQGAPGDDRRVIELPDSARSALRMAMLRQLETLHATAVALGEGDTAGARELAAERGMGAPRQLAAVIGPVVPQEFMTLSRRNHEAFDALAEAAGSGATGEELHAAFAGVLGACVSCHQTFTAR